MSVTQDVIIPGPSGERVKAKIKTDVSISAILPPINTTWGQLHGVNWKSSVLSWKEIAANPPNNAISTNDINKFMTICANNNWNLIRLVLYQETYEGHKAAFFNEIKAIIEAADQRGIAVIIDNHQWHIGDGAYTDSLGFPQKYLSGYNITGEPCSYENNCNNVYTPVSPEAVKFWQDLVRNSLKNFPDVWSDIAKYFDAIIDFCEPYENVIGYEILNEPQTTGLTDYGEMGTMNTFLAQRMRLKTSRDILYCRDNGIGPHTTQHPNGWGGNNGARDQLIPAVSGVIYDNHSYSLRRMKNSYVAETNEAINNRTDIKVLVGEWAAQLQFDPTNSLTLDNTKFVLQLCKDNGYAICWWAIGQFALAGQRNWKCLTFADGSLRPEGLIYKQAISEVYV